MYLKRKKILTGYFSEDVYLLLHLPILIPNSIWQICFYNVCQNNLKIEYFIHKRFGYDHE